MLLPFILLGQSAAFSVQVDNDILNLINQTDRYYTSGIQIAAYHNNLNNSLLNAILIGDKQTGIQLSGIVLRQAIYTPTDIYTDKLLVGDRPYASYLEVSQERITASKSKNYRVRSEIGLGLLGKYSGGQALQNFIHSLTPYSENANGWQHQINHDVVIDYKVELEKGMINTNMFQLNAVGKLNVGTLLNRSDIGLSIHTGIFEGYFASAMPVSGHNKFSIRLFADANLAYVFYDATLQGGLINQNNGYKLDANQIQNKRLNYRFGIQTSYKKLNLEFGRIWETKEFYNAMDHGWGYIKFQILIP
jgi:hypothetical protein